jgi:hypothetical protein
MKVRIPATSNTPTAVAVYLTVFKKRMSSLIAFLLQGALDGLREQPGQDTSENFRAKYMCVKSKCSAARPVAARI